MTVLIARDRDLRPARPAVGVDLRGGVIDAVVAGDVEGAPQEPKVPDLLIVVARVLVGEGVRSGVVGPDAGLVDRAPGIRRLREVGGVPAAEIDPAEGR